MMKRILFGLFCTVVVVSVALPAGACSQETPPKSSALTLYVGEVKGEEDLVRSVRAQLVDELVMRGIALVASEKEADATLTGSGIHRAGTRFMVGTHDTVSIVIRGHLQLIACDGRKLWSGDVSSKRWAFSETGSFAQTAAGRVAQILRQLSPQMASERKRPAA